MAISARTSIPTQSTLPQSGFARRQRNLSNEKVKDITRMNHDNDDFAD
jgi:hypothetical protein